MPTDTATIERVMAERTAVDGLQRRLIRVPMQESAEQRKSRQKAGRALPMLEYIAINSPEWARR
jgi:hypothetical protein